MKNLSTESIEEFKELGYSFEEIESINIGLEQANNGDTIPFSKVLYEFYSDKKESLCMK